MSSSSSYCLHPDCQGGPCAHFTDWVVNGVDSTEVQNNTIFLRFNTFGSVQQVELYQDPSYFFLVAIGQRNNAGEITISPRNDSEINGTVQWDGVLTSFSETAILHCYELSTSSSSSSIDSKSSLSSSSSSTDQSSNSSSSSNCCVNPYCDGIACQYFSNWMLSGMNKHNSDSCRLYVGFDAIYPISIYDDYIQQIRLYKDSSLSYLVSIGQGTPGTIVLNQVNNSGLSGTVEWNGILVDYPNFIILDCVEFSSSSSSSSSSLDSLSSSSVDSLSSSSSSVDSSSTSSSSSEEYSSSSSSSSSSSMEYSSSSSSSSIDSSSSSSIDSSSSSSSIEMWNRVKPLLLANSAISDGLIKNRLAQTLYIIDDIYPVGSVYCYLIGNYGKETDYTVNLAIYSCDDDGAPSNQLHISSISGLSILSSGWYEFEFDVVINTPANKYLSFVMWQDGGNENNYAMWAYNFYDIDSVFSDTFNMAWLSNDNINWVSDQNVERSLRIVGNYNGYNLDESRVETQEAELREVQLNFGERSPLYFGTKLNDNNNLVLDYKPVALSFVIDNSGSMGWNDRYGNRQVICQQLVQKIIDKYPSDYLFDFITFGARIANATSVNSNIGEPATINIDANRPQRSTYIFQSDNAVTVKKGDIYSHNGYTYVVSNDVDNNERIMTLGDGASLQTGTLNKVSGSGPQNIVFGSVLSTSMSSNFCAFGFKNLIDGNTYNIGDVVLDELAINSPSLTNWTLYHDVLESSTISLGDNGPNSAKTVDILASSSLVARRNFTNAFINRTYVSANITKGDNEISVTDSSVFLAGQKIDILDSKNISTNHTIASIQGNKIKINPACSADMLTSQKAVVELSGINFARKLDGTTFKLLVRDAAVGNVPIVFFIQSTNGGMMEWDILPFSEWIFLSVFWIDRTASLPVSIFDEDDNPFPDGTMVVLEVDRRQAIEDLTKQTERLTVTEVANVGDTKIYVDTLEGYAVGDTIDISQRSSGSGGAVQTVTIKEIGKEGDLFYLELFEPLKFEFDPAKNSKIKHNKKPISNLNNGDLVSFPLSLVDVTPVETGIVLDPSIKKPYDPPSVPAPVDPDDEDEKNAIYDSINYNSEYIQYGTVDAPSASGYVYVRVLPVTEDILQSDVDKAFFAEQYLRGEPAPIYTDQIESNDGDIDSIEIPSEQFFDSTIVIGDDYKIQSPVFLQNGVTTSAMSSTATALVATDLEGYNMAGVGSIPFFTKYYTIYPHIRQESVTGALKAIQYFDEFDVNFSSPVQIYSDARDNREVSFWCEKLEMDELGCGPFPIGYEEKKGVGVYAGDDPVVINYVITSRGTLIRDGFLKIKIYSNPILNQEAWVCSYWVAEIYQDQSRTKQYINFSNPNEVSDINSWREMVNSNPFSQQISNTSGDGDVATGGGFLSGLQERIANSEFGKHQARIAKIDAAAGGGEAEEFYEFYSNPESWTLATQYESYELSIPIVNGRAQLQIPPNPVVSTLFIEAAYAISNTVFEAIRADLIFVRSPLMVGELSPYESTPSGDPEQRWELGGVITWKDGIDGVIDDNTSVNYRLRTRATPSVSSTIDGWAGGVFLGPKNRILLPADYDECGSVPVTEAVTVVMTHPSGQTSTISRNIWWYPYNSEGDVDSFYFKVSSGTRGWAIGLGNPKSSIISDLNDGYNDLPYWVGEYGVLALRGLDQPNGVPSTIEATYVSNRYQSWESNTVEFFDNTGLNKNIGHHPISGNNKKAAPWDQEITMVTGYYQEDGSRRRGVGLTGLPYPGIDGLIFPYSVLSYQEPLSITISSIDKWFRDGMTSCEIIAEVMWQGLPITNKVIINESTINYQVPTVTFLAGAAPEKLDENGQKGKITNSTGGEDPEYIDFRGSFECILSTTPHQDVKLSSYESVIVWEKTRNHTLTLNGATHYHTCSVNSDGDGFTTSVIEVGYYVSDHTHTINEFIIENTIATFIQHGKTESNTYDHNHIIISVAKTTLLPTTNEKISADIIGIVEYDPTNCEPYTKSIGLKYTPKSKRLMFDSISFDPDPISNRPLLYLYVTTEPNPPSDSTSAATYYVSKTVFETDKGFNIKAKAYFSAYQTVDIYGNIIEFPARDVDDGTRIITQVRTFIPAETIEGEKGLNTGVIISGADVERNYLLLEVKCSVFAEGQYAEETIQCALDSNLNWLPGYKALVIDPTNDLVYISNASSYSQTIGGSPIYDSIRLAAKRMITHQEKNPSVADYRKAVILLTDGDENGSEYSLNQAITSVSLMDNDENVPIIPVRLGKPYSLEEVILTKMYVDTSGFMIDSFNIDVANIPYLVSSIFRNEKFVIAGNGLYRNIAALDDINMFDSLSMGGTSIPDGCSVEYRYRTSVDGTAWGIWSDWLYSNETHTVGEDIDLASLYFEYEFRLRGNEDFESPEVEDDLTIKYYKHNDFVIIFNGISIGGGSTNYNSGFNDQNATSNDAPDQNDILNAQNTNTNSQSSATSNATSNDAPDQNDILNAQNTNTNSQSSENSSSKAYAEQVMSSNFLSSIHITNEVDLPPTSTIQYGITQSDSDEINSFYSWIDPDKNTIMLTRYNEPLVTVNYREYTALNGTWPEKVNINIYRLNSQFPDGDLVDPSEYSANNYKGIITFYNGQVKTDKFVICVEVYPSFRLACKMINYGSKKAVLHHIGIIYNMMKRIPTDSRGNITHKPINLRMP